MRKMRLIIIDAALINLSMIVALYLRFEGSVPSQYLNAYGRVSPVYTVVSIIVLALFGLYSIILQYVSIDDLMTAISASLVSSGALWCITRYWLTPGFPRSVLVISAIIQAIFIAGVRLSKRLGLRLYHKFLNGKNGGDCLKVLVIGAGDAGAMVGRELQKPLNPPRRVVGYIDDDRSKVGSHIFGVRVLGGRELLPQVIGELDVDEVIIAMPSAPSSVVRDVLKRCQGLEVKIRIMPRLLEIGQKAFRLDMLKDIDIEDLLGRPEIHLDMGSIERFLHGKTVLVTGAGGSIGSEIVRQVAGFEPKKIILLGHGENSIFEAKISLQEKYPEVPAVTTIADVRDSARIHQVFSEHLPDVVFHAAAHKHVPLMEESLIEAIKTNVFGTLNVARAAARFGAKKFVMISTDKAVNPTSVMGASKRVAELVVSAMNMLTKDTSFVAVRFGNVLGSRGSVVPLFKRQIERGGPLTVTHPDMRRYFMTIGEAVSLVLQAAAMGEGGEIFVLDMGEPVKILDLAEQMIRLSGRVPYTDIDIVFTGMRPGEKLFEEILTSEEGTTATWHKQIYIARQKPISLPELEKHLARLESLVFPENWRYKVFDGVSRSSDETAASITQRLLLEENVPIDDGSCGPSRDEAIMEILKALIPTYRPNR